MNRMLKHFLATLAVICSAGVGAAQDVTLRLHHFLPERANLHSKFIVPFAESVEAASDGRIKFELFTAMSLGGRPGDLFDQAADGAVDIVMTLPGYTAGRFPQAEVFELPFMMEDAVATSGAYWDLIESTLQDGDFADAKILTGWVHGPGVIHSKDPILSLEDLQGKELRGPTRLVTDLLGELGASPVGMPVPAIPENISKGVISGAVVPWEIVPAIKLHELVGNHTEIPGDRSLYTSVFVLAMNWDSYEGMPDDLRAILDAETGKALAKFAANMMVEADAPGRGLAGGNAIHSLSKDEVARWIEASSPVYDRWIEMAKGAGFDGAAAIDTARGLIAQNQ